jgi:hypothetical protein
MIVTNEQKVVDLANAIVARTQEVYNYDNNISFYQRMIDEFGESTPSYIEPIKNLPYDQAIAACPIEHIADFARFSQAQRAKFLIRTETMERTKANMFLEDHIAQLRALVDTDAEYESAIADAISRRG